MEEGTVFERESVAQKAGRYIFLLLVVLIIAVGFFTWARISTGSHNALQEARGVRAAMKLVSIEYYGGNGSIYDRNAYDGMAKEAEDRKRTMSYADGDIELKAWDDLNNVPIAFTYRKDPYVIEFRAVGDMTDPNNVWDVYYAFHMMQYTTEQGPE